jgi:Niemann-Pick C1 protein
MSSLSTGAAFWAFLALLALSTATGEVDVIHEEGRCFWSGECPIDVCGKTVSEKNYNIFNNSMAFNLTAEEDSELYGLIEEMCPMYIDPNTSIAHVCCTTAQIKSFKASIGAGVAMINRCPACLKNFIKHYCVVACDPSGSAFMTGHIQTVKNDTNVRYVENATFYLSEKYAADLYNSCANVQFAAGGSSVMSLLCGDSNCNPQKFLNFQGNPKLDGDEAPFLITYELFNSTQPIGGGISPLGDTGIHSFYKCNETVEGLGACSCSDCPIVCPAPPTFTETHLPFWTITWYIGGTGFFLSTIIFIAAMVTSLYFLFSHKKSGYQPIAEEDSPPLTTSTYGSTAPPENGPATKSGLNNDVHVNYDEEGSLGVLGQCCQVGNYVERLIKLVFYHWGRFVAKFWFLVLIFAVVIAGILSFGLFFFTVTTDPVELWSAPTSRARLEKNYFDKHFGPFYRTEQIIVKAKPFVEPASFQPDGTVNVTWTFGSVFNQALLKEVLHIQNHLATMEVEYNDGDGNVTNITLSEICFSPLAPENKNCTIESVLNYFQNDESQLDRTPGFFSNYLYHIHYCTRFPFSLDETQSKYNIPCVGAYGGDIDPNVALGGFNKSSDGPGYNYDTSTVLIITFVVNNHVRDEDNKMAMAWEKAMLEYLHDYKENHNTSLIDIEYSTERSIVDEINRESKTDVYTIAGSYLLMFLYITICLGHVRSFKTILVDMKLEVGLVGVLLVLFAVTSSLGVYSFLKLEASLIVLEVVPFLVLAVGVDNLFILVHSYERQVKELAKERGCNWNKIPISEIIGRSVGEVAPSLLLTGLSETLAFLLGAISIMPAVRSFSLYAGTAVFFNLVLQLSVFVAIMSLDAMRQLRNRVELAPCIALSGKFNPLLGYSYLSIIMKYFADVILYPLVRPFILLVFGLTLTSSLVLMFRLDIGLNQNLALPKDSYLIPYFNELFVNLHTGSPVYFVIKEGVNYTSPATQNMICSSAGCDDDSLGNQITIYARAPNESGIAESPLNWLDTYFAWLSINGGCCGLNTSSPKYPDFCDHPENGTECVPCSMTSRPNATEFGDFIWKFKNTNPSTACSSGGHAAFGDAIKLTEDNKTVITSYIMTYHNQLQDSPEFINALKRARQLAENVTAIMGNGTVFPYSVFYVYYEQYLTIIHDMLLNIGVALGAVFLVSFLLTGFNLWAAVIILGFISSIILHMLGSMAVLGINANAVSLVNLVMTVGIAVEFCVHIVRWFVSCKLPSRTERAHSALHHMGTSVFSGITVTKFLGVGVLLFAKSQLFEIYYFRMYMCMLVWGALHGLVLLPVVLSYVGPPYFRNTLSSPYNDNNLSAAPILTTHDHPNPPVHSYDGPTPSTTPTNARNGNTHQGYPPPTRNTASEMTPPPDQFYPKQKQRYPSPTYPRNGSAHANENSRLLN